MTAVKTGDMPEVTSITDSTGGGLLSSKPGEEPAEAMSGTKEEDEFPADWRKITLVMVALYLSMFLVALDRTIIGTAIPQIVHDFQSINDVGWYASSYLITSSAFQLVYGRIYTFYNPKYVMLIAILNFEIGSTICGAAPNSTSFIIGRALAGLGGAGIFSGAINIMVITIPLHKRPMFQGIFGAIFGVASVLGPFLGGAFTTHVSWRWCFYINLPVGAVVVSVLFFILDVPRKENNDTLRQQFIKLDPWGQLVFLPGVVCLLLALQWGGVTYAWSSTRIIVLLVLAAILLTIFIVIQFRSGENATVPIRIVKQRSILSGIWFSFVSSGGMFIMIYYLPIWFQAIKGVTAVQSGVDTFPLVIALVVASILSGIATQKSGYYVPQVLLCTILMSIGAGLLTTFVPSTPSPKWIGYQIIFGFGLGFGMQIPGMAAQTVLGKEDVMTGVSLMFFMQGLGGSLWISIAQILFNEALGSGLGSIQGLDVEVVVQSGTTELGKIVPVELMGAVFAAYNHALIQTFKVALACACATIVTGLTLEWRSVKGLMQGGPAVPKKKGDVEEVGEKTVEDLSTDVEEVKEPEEKK